MARRERQIGSSTDRPDRNDMNQRRPNILWYCTDQQRFDTIGALGNPHAQTPTIDQLVADGVAFTHAYCQSPICTPSRSSFMTGMYPSRVHNTRNGNETFATDTIFRNIRVLAIGKQLDVEKKEEGADGNVATLELSPRQAEMLAQANSIPQMALTLIGG